MMRAVTVTVRRIRPDRRALAAQQPAFKRTVLQQSDISAPGREVVSAVAEFDPAATPGRTRISAKRSATCSKARS